MCQILYGGCDTRHCGSFFMQRPEGLPNYVLLIIKSHCAFSIGGQHQLVTPGHAIIISPLTPYSYSSTTEDYTDDYLHFSITDPVWSDQLLPIANALFPIRNSENLTNFIRQILWEHFYAPASYKDENINALFIVLFCRLCDCKSKALHASRIPSGNTLMRWVSANPIFSIFTVIFLEFPFRRISSIFALNMPSTSWPLQN